MTSSSAPADVSVPSLFNFGFAFANALNILLESLFIVGAIGVGVLSLLDGSLAPAGFALSFGLPKKSCAPVLCCFGSDLTEAVVEGCEAAVADSVVLDLAAG
jgi:hypothetical protein